jgi:hypothetical protein
MKRDGKYSLNTFHYGCFNSLPFRQKLKNVLFLSANSIMKGKLPVLIYFCYQTDSEVTNTNIYSAVFLAFPNQLIINFTWIFMSLFPAFILGFGDSMSLSNKILKWQ